MSILLVMSEQKRSSSRSKVTRIKSIALYLMVSSLGDNLRSHEMRQEVPGSKKSSLAGLVKFNLLLSGLQKIKFKVKRAARKALIELEIMNAINLI